MIDLHERLSEYSFGYGVTREVEALLATVGVHATPFLPNLQHENALGFDVGLKAKGVVVALQFKLGHELKRFRASTNIKSMPPLERPFWRFPVDTGGDQFKHLRKYEKDGAEVYYVAPRFSTWKAYDRAFQAGKVLSNSLLIEPSTILTKLKVSNPSGGPGSHRVLYDSQNSYICSNPIQLPNLSPEKVAHTLKNRVNNSEITLSEQLLRIYERRGKASSGESIREQRIFSRANRREDAILEILSTDALAQGAQLLFAANTTVSSHS